MDLKKKCHECEGAGSVWHDFPEWGATSGDYIPCENCNASGYLIDNPSDIPQNKTSDSNN